MPRLVAITLRSGPGGFTIGMSSAGGLVKFRKKFSEWSPHYLKYYIKNHVWTLVNEFRDHGQRSNVVAVIDVDVEQQVARVHNYLFDRFQALINAHPIPAQ